MLYEQTNRKLLLETHNDKILPPTPYFRCSAILWPCDHLQPTLSTASWHERPPSWRLDRAPPKHASPQHPVGQRVPDCGCLMHSKIGKKLLINIIPRYYSNNWYYYSCRNGRRSRRAQAGRHVLFAQTGIVPDADGLVEWRTHNHVFAWMKLGAHHIVIVTWTSISCKRYPNSSW